MINSLNWYARGLWTLMSRPAGWKLLYGEPRRLMLSRLAPAILPAERKRLAADEAVRWLLRSQAAGTDGGMGTYYIHRGWTSSYPETTGYIIPSLLRYHRLFPDPKVEEAAAKALNWLLSIQKPSGGWAGGYVHQNRPEIVFNTGQVLRGLLAGYRHFGDERYALAARTACNWLVEIRNPEGYFDKHVYLDAVRVYDTYVAAPLQAWGKELNEPAYAETAKANVLWVVRHKQLKNGWYPDADNTVARNEKPILHTIAYTLDGLLETGYALNLEEVITSAQVTARQLITLFDRPELPPGRWDKNWQGSTETLLTGCAQTALAWLQLHRAGEEGPWKAAAEQVASRLYHLQLRGQAWPEDWRGGLFGSAPFWGRYEPFGMPNWGVKYYLDLMLTLLEDESR